MQYLLRNNISQEVNKTFDTSAIDCITFAKIRAELFPVLAVREKFDLDARKQMAKTYIADTMKPIDSERAYMEHFVSGEYMPELLFDDKEIVEQIKKHPMALWKCR
jgi:hypothetical protein